MSIKYELTQELERAKYTIDDLVKRLEECNEDKEKIRKIIKKAKKKIKLS